MVPLGQHNLLCYFSTLPNGAKSENVGQPRICLLVPMSNTHSPTRSNIETSKDTVIVYDGNKPYVVRKHIDVIRGRNGHSNFELKENKPNVVSSDNKVVSLYAEGRIPHIKAQSL